ncbi:ABC transporter ATP-binding protein [Paraburkholderia aspalathi]|nr:ABC transporter ATP-binding protein [Paraburkholderia aspalathi]
MLELRNAAKMVGGEYHIHPTNLSLARSSLNVLLGPTLSGKTSLMRLMAGLDRPTSGSIHVDGVDVTGVPVQKRNIAMVYQQFINYPAFSVYENIASPMRIAGKTKAEIDRQVRKAAELMKLTPYLERTPLHLSGGQQQRTALARALVKNATLVLLDEPLANLDYKLREELREELPKIFAQSGAIFVYATTDPIEALLLGGHTATLNEGHVTQFGATIDVYRNPVNLVTADIFADPPLNSVAVVKSGNVFLQGSIKFLDVPAHLSQLSDGPMTVAFHPHHINFVPQTASSAMLTARTLVSEITGSESFVHLLYNDERWVMLARGIHNVEPDSSLTVYIDSRHVMAFDIDGRALVTTQREM